MTVDVASSLAMSESDPESFNTSSTSFTVS